jgi:DNA-binding response OmpR family regulator
MARILVIDDDDQIRAMLGQVLKREGHEVAQAPDGNVGMRLFREQGADLIITDIVMPEKEGIETIIELRNNFPEVKIIAMSGGGRMNADEYLALAKSLGVKATLTKPFELKELLAAVRALLE